MARATPVSPAHAGMDHDAGQDAGRTGGFPRTRGDGPNARFRAVKLNTFPPHTRGWTLVQTAQYRVAQVSPAHAGMDPCRHRASPWAACFPRTRGDGPRRSPSPSSHPKFPPHTRGWTVLDPRIVVQLRVSPAHAGMDRGRRRPLRSGRRFPRTRGDGPSSRISRFDRCRFPPHTRGWTMGLRRTDRPGMVSPAHAGMDRNAAAPRDTPASFPRTRGDGPHSGVVNPLQPEFPPHTRGWTVRLAGRAELPSVSPAHAGMDLNQITENYVPFSFPRTRGDGPASLTVRN